MQSIPFEYYLRIEGLQSITFKDLWRWAKFQKDLTIFPETWEGYIWDQGYDSIIRQHKFALPGNGSCIENISLGEMPDFKHDIVVYPSIGPRAFDCKDIQHVKIADIINKSLLKVVDQFQLKAGEYDVVHLRGGTKIWAGGSVKSDCPNRLKYEQWDDPNVYLNEIHDVLEMLNTNKQIYPLFILTDTPCMAEWWQERYGEAILLPNSAHGLMEESGIHKLSKDKLYNLNDKTNVRLTKEDLNIEAIRDFVIMNNSRTLVGDGVSLFSMMAYGLKSNNARLSSLPNPEEENVKDITKDTNRVNLML